MLQIYKKMCAKQNKSIKTYQGICFFITFGFAEDTFVRKNKQKRLFVWFFAHLIVSLSPKSIPTDYLTV